MDANFIDFAADTVIAKLELHEMRAYTPEQLNLFNGLKQFTKSDLGVFSASSLYFPFLSHSNSQLSLVCFVEHARM